MVTSTNDSGAGSPRLAIHDVGGMAIDRYVGTGQGGGVYSERAATVQDTDIVTNTAQGGKGDEVRLLCLSFAVSLYESSIRPWFVFISTDSFAGHIQKRSVVVN